MCRVTLPSVDSIVYRPDVPPTFPPLAFDVLENLKPARVAQSVFGDPFEANASLAELGHRLCSISRTPSGVFMRYTCHTGRLSPAIRRWQKCVKCRMIHPPADISRLSDVSSWSYECYHMLSQWWSWWLLWCCISLIAHENALCRRNWLRKSVKADRRCFWGPLQKSGIESTLLYFWNSIWCCMRSAHIYR